MLTQDHSAFDMPANPIEACCNDRIFPLITVLLPVLNEDARIKTCLMGIISNDYPQNKLEIIVIDGGSTDKTIDLVNAMAREFPIQLLHNPRAQRAVSLNMGIRAAHGDVILRMDARSQCPSDYIRKLVLTLLQTGAANVGGHSIPVGEGVTQKAVSIAMSHPFGIGNARFRLGGSGEVDTVYMGCFRRDIFDKVGLFDEISPIISEDSELNYRIRKAGEKIYLNDDIRVFYEPRSRLSDLFRLYFRYGGARAGVFLKHHAFTASRQLIPLLFLLYIAAGSLCFFLGPVWFKLWLSGLMIYFAVLLFVSLSILVPTKQWRLGPRLFFCFLIIHLAWPMGFFIRLIQSLLRPDPPGYYWKN